MLETEDITHRFGKSISEFDGYTETIISKEREKIPLNFKEYNQRGYLQFEAIPKADRMREDRVEYLLQNQGFVRKQTKLFLTEKPDGKRGQKILQYYENTGHGRIITQYFYEYGDNPISNILILQEGENVNTILAKVSFDISGKNILINSIYVPLGPISDIEEQFPFNQFAQSVSPKDVEYFSGVRIHMSNLPKTSIQDMRIDKNNVYLRTEEDFALLGDIHLTSGWEGTEHIVTTIPGEKDQPHIFRSTNSKDLTTISLSVASNFTGLSSFLIGDSWETTNQVFPVKISFT